MEQKSLLRYRGNKGKMLFDFEVQCNFPFKGNDDRILQYTGCNNSNDKFCLAFNFDIFCNNFFWTDFFHEKEANV